MTFSAAALDSHLGRRELLRVGLQDLTVFQRDGGAQGAGQPVFCERLLPARELGAHMRAATGRSACGVNLDAARRRPHDAHEGALAARYAAADAGPLGGMLSERATPC